MTTCLNGELNDSYELNEINVLDIANSYYDDDVTLCGNTLTDNQKKSLDYFRKLYKLEDDPDKIFINDFDIMSTEFDYFKDPNKENKAVIMDSKNKSIPIVYKDEEGVYYFKPIKTSDFFKEEKPTLHLKKFSDGKELTRVIQQPNLVIEDKEETNYFFIGIIIFVVIISIIILLYFMYKN